MANVTRNNNRVTIVELKRSLVPANWEESVRVIGISECKEAALSLAHAFATDDLSQYLLSADDMADLSPEDKWRLHVDMMNYIVAAHCYNGIVTTIGADYDAVALWMPPGKNMDDLLTIVRSGMWRLYFQLSVEGRKRYYDELLPLLHDTKAAVMGDRDADSWYLVYIGTKPGARGKGYARKLIEHMMKRADAEKRPVYLESSSAENIAYYRKFGFEPRKDIFLKRGPAPVCLSIMVRESQPVASVVPVKTAYSSSVVVAKHADGLKV